MSGKDLWPMSADCQFLAEVSRESEQLTLKNASSP